MNKFKKYCPIKAALRGDKQAQADCTSAGVLLPCPFCGGEAKLHESFKIIPVIDENGAYVDADIENSPSWVYCTACNAAGQDFDVDENDEENAIDAWNRRAERTGLWITRDTDNPNRGVYCSECRALERPEDSQYLSPRCPQCGCRMIGGEDDATD